MKTSLNNFIKNILKSTSKRVSDLRSSCKFGLDMNALSDLPKCSPFDKAFTKNGISLIAEVKPISPSIGAFSESLPISDRIKIYEQAGSRALSILTEPASFGGNLENIKTAKECSSLPVIRKDFIISVEQIIESRLASADAILLIVSILNFNDLKTFIEITKMLGMSALVETHNESEIKMAVDAGANIIGINNRNLETLEVDLQVSVDLLKLIPDNIIAISESGIYSSDDVQTLYSAGANGILVGSALMESYDPSNKINELLLRGGSS